MHFSPNTAVARAAALLGLAALALLPGAAHAGPNYTLTVLGFLPSGTSSFGLGVNNSGQVTGYSNAPNGDHAFLSGPSGGPLTDLGTLGGTNSQGYGVNNSGQVTGNLTLSNGVSHTFLSGSNGGPLTDLGTLPGGIGSVGSFGTGLNNSGQVTGSSVTSNVLSHAFLSGLNGGPLTDLGTLPGGKNSQGNGVNNSGQVTGFSTTSSGISHAFLSGPNGGPLTDLGTLGGTNSQGLGINDSGQVVGDSGGDAFLYQNGVMTDLNTLIVPALGFTLNVASSISNTGFIAGYGTFGNGQTEAFLLTPTELNPVPEASTTASFGLLLALGLGGVVIAKKRKQSA